MTIGVDLDNTIICYDGVFYRTACELNLIPPSVAPKKSDIKNAVLSAHDNDMWTELQGIVYGLRMKDAEPYPEVFDFFLRCREMNVTTCIVSHKSLFPARGPQVNLREAALEWLEANGWLDPQGAGLTRDRIEFTETRQEKIAAISRRECDTFIDDLPEVFAERNFPSRTTACLFDPERRHADWPGGRIAAHWSELIQFLS